MNDAELHTANKIIEFVTGIGIRVERAPVPDDSFLPGIDVVDGGLVVDESKLKWPGDILHEAGHLAVTPATHRATMHGTVEATGQRDVAEVEAICWSYAACVQLGIDPRIVFHEDGYGGRSESLLTNFSMGVFLGVPGLEKAGMTFSPTRAREKGVQSFPAMIRWLRDGD